MGRTHSASPGESMSIANVGKVIGQFEKNIMRVVKEGTDLLTNPNHTKEDELKWEQDCKNVFKTGTQDVGDEAYSQAKEGATKHLMDRGFSKEEAERWSENVAKKVMDQAEKVRAGIPKVEQAAKLGWLKFVAAVTAIFGAVMTFSFMQRDERADKSRKMLAFVEHIEEERKIMVSTEDFNLMAGSLLVTSAPPVTTSAPPTAAAAAAPLPPPVAAIAAAPALVEIKTESGKTQTVNTTVERVYRSAPPRVQNIMRNYPPFHIEHDYDKPGSGTENDYQHYEQHPHKSFTVSTDFASIHVSY
jgi:hypothetical protein